MNLKPEHLSLISLLAAEELTKTLKDLRDIVDEHSPVVRILQKRREILLHILSEIGASK